jgi:hypothetical protein
VKASNSCVGTLIFDSFFFIVFCQSFFFFLFRPFSFFFLAFYYLFSFCRIGFCFLSSFVFPLLFRHCFIPISLAHVVSYLAYPNLLETKRLGCCCTDLREGSNRQQIFSRLAFSTCYFLSVCWV